MRPARWMRAYVLAGRPADAHGAALVRLLLTRTEALGTSGPGHTGLEGAAAGRCAGATAGARHAAAVTIEKIANYALMGKRPEACLINILASCRKVPAFPSGRLATKLRCKMPRSMLPSSGCSGSLVGDRRAGLCSARFQCAATVPVTSACQRAPSSCACSAGTRPRWPAPG